MGLQRTTETAALGWLRAEEGWTRALASGVSEAARGGRAWLGVSAAGMAMPRTRRSAVEGMEAWALATGAAFALKGLAHRRRPGLIRPLGRNTSSSSMPSSHTAAAVAYATAATWRTPVTAVLVVPAAGLVAWSRLGTARHFPTDVAVGAAVGLAIGALVHTANDLAGRRPSPPSTPSQPV